MVVEKNNRVLFIASGAPRYEGDVTASSVLSQASALQELGWEVDLLVPHASGLQREEVLEGVAIHRYRYPWPGRLRDVPALPLLLGCYFTGMKLALRKRYGIIHSHGLLLPGLAGKWIAWFFTVPHMSSVRGRDMFALNGKISRFCKQQVLVSADSVIANSSYTQGMIQQFAPAAKVTVIPNGVTPAEMPGIAVSKEAYVRPGSPLLVLIGRIVEEKGLVHAIDALGLLVKEGRDAALLVVGEGPDHARCEQRVHALGLQGKVHFTGAVPPGEVSAYLAIADIVVVPSCTGADGWVEGQGNSVIEAMNAGIPVIASNLGGIVDAVMHERTGLLVPEKDAGAIARAVIRLMDRPGLAKGLAEQAKRHAEQYFSRAACAGKIAELYTRLQQKTL